MAEKSLVGCGGTRLALTGTIWMLLGFLCLLRLVSCCICENQVYRVLNSFSNKIILPKVLASRKIIFVQIECPSLQFDRTIKVLGSLRIVFSGPTKGRYFENAFYDFLCSKKCIVGLEKLRP